MDTRQTLNIVDKYFNTFEIFGSENLSDFITILYLMFIDEYYEFERDISLKDIDDNEIGLTDCLVKKLNHFIEYLKTNSNILQGVELDYLPTKNHWIIPDEGYDDYIEDNILYTEDSVTDNILITDKHIIDNILQL